MAPVSPLRALVERLTGHPSAVAHCFLDDLDEEQFWASHRVGLSQLNEMLLALAYETLSEALFRHIFDGDPTTGVVRDQFIAGVGSFEQLALLKYGNVKFGLGAGSRDLGSQATQRISSNSWRNFGGRPTRWSGSALRLRTIDG